MAILACWISYKLFSDPIQYLTRVYSYIVFYLMPIVRVFSKMSLTHHNVSALDEYFRSKDGSKAKNNFIMSRKLLLSVVAAITILKSTLAFVPVSKLSHASKTFSGLGMIDPLMLAEQVSSSSFVLAETESWVKPLSLILDPFLNFFSFAMVRSCLSAQ
jgi:hypothetical protein